MDIRLHQRLKTSSDTSTQAVFRKKQPVGVQSQPTSIHKQSTLSLQAQLERATRFGHHFSRVTVHGGNAVGVQTKLTVGKPGDKYEQEADQVADKVMAMPIPNAQQQIQRQADNEEEQIQTQPLAASITPTVQLQSGDEEEEEVQTKSLGTSTNLEIQRQAEDEEEELQTKSLGTTANPEVQRQAIDEEEVQTKPSLQRQAALSSQNSGPSLESRLTAQKGGGSALSNDVRAFMEPRFGSNFSQVRVHTGSDAVQMNRELNAQAFAHGRDIYFGAGKYNPGSSDGKRLLAHELTHVVQQTGSN